ncbi:MAG: hypothetical protein H6Q73_182 [Firmicutes bacterium]|nr:hypothetical protein [Bacillota bacterium]
MSREKTVDEVREQFLEYVVALINYWDKSVEGTARYKLEGLAHSLLSTLDGCSSGLPRFIVAPYPHPDDKQFCIEIGDDYYAENNSKIKCDIAGGLHEQLCRYLKAKESKP